MAISTYLSVITLNVSGLNDPIEGHRVAEWIEKNDPSTCCLQETHFRIQPVAHGPHVVQDGYECGPTQNHKFT